MMINPRHTLGTLVTTRPEFATGFDRLGLDYCCGGQRTLAEAVAAAGLDLDDVIDVLEADSDGTSTGGWAHLGLAELVDHLEATHHAYLDEALPRLSQLAAKVDDVHGERHPELAEVRRLVGALRADMEPHLRKEEQVLFPMIRQLAAATTPPTFHCGSLADPISVMLREHDDVGDLLAALRSAAGDFAVPDDGCASYRSLFAGLAELEADTHLHVHKENNLLFPAVAEAERALADA
ncbi:MAG TPA: iron-sulfur cluster repair di-iron protein [Ilumatobacteraceae bacterium]|nr:iron-sulfur cluster repair di-iron protein [Ilumatobacteraceae bacterium]